ncbi:MAG: guanylate kinase [Bryocella sp.]
MAGILFIISAPSGSGKSTLVNGVRALVPGLEFSVSYTTRAPRGSEKEGVEYHFIEKAKFQAMIAEDKFLEYAVVFGDNYYGTAMSALDEARDRGHDLLLDIDVQGALQVMKRVPEAVSIFILPPSPQILEMRLRNRSQAEGVTDDSVIERRLAQARSELEMLSRYQYAIVNDQLDTATDEMKAIVLHERHEQNGDAKTAESCLTRTHSARLDAALSNFALMQA